VADHGSDVADGVNHRRFVMTWRTDRHAIALVSWMMTSVVWRGATGEADSPLIEPLVPFES
jgi:hypothetical protein